MTEQLSSPLPVLPHVQYKSYANVAGWSTSGYKKTRSPWWLRALGDAKNENVCLSRFSNELKLLQLHSLFVRRWLLLGKAVDIAASQ